VDISKIIPERFVRYQWQKPETAPYDPATAVPFPMSRHAWGSIGHAGEVVPNGNDVAAVPLQPDGTRGVVALWADWFKGIGGGNNYLRIAILDNVGDPVPPTFLLNPTNTLAGRGYITTAAGETSASVATKIATVIDTMLLISGLQAKFQKLGGQIVANFARVDLGAGTVAVISPAPWMPIQLQSLSGVWGNIGPDAFEANQGTYRPEFLAGCRPAPWLVVGNAWRGRGEDHGLIG
jgi:hypothetical protein